MKVEIERIKKVDALPTKAFADIIVDNMLVLKGYRVVQGKKELFVSPPQHKGKNGKFWSDVFIKNDKDGTIRKIITDVILKAYNQ